MKKFYTIFTAILTVMVAQYGNAQTEQETISELKNVFKEFEIRALSPCKVHLVDRIDEEAYSEYLFNPKDATWEAKSIGIYTDWTIIEKNKITPYKNSSEIGFYIMMHLDDLAFHQKAADLLNHLATFCKEPSVTHREEFSDKDLMKFYFDYTDLMDLIKPGTEILDNKIQGYATAPETIKQNYVQVKNNGGLAELPKQEQEDYQKTLVFFEENRAEVEKQVQQFFDGPGNQLPENQYTQILNTINSDPKIAKRLEKVVTEFYQ
ncbi:hypothetical protein SAMN02927921_02138 [Sinomicrobium oceani]|uniref:Uncharacterized protein n=1 Tax=Sinomicrobium oceani TaxID=1150368 RepID=A0A1K1Q0B4_9FLAO|nr:hypothetical protein [Sinomicrobium oceani]SFW52558.1 hypothetical protein SAMN02927921_02138 [Sinomicrobium oceani]